MEELLVGELLEELLTAADEAADASGVYTNAGKLGVRMQCRAWNNGEISDITPQQYKDLPKASGQKQIDLILSVDIQELKPELDFGLERTVAYRKKDWYDTLKASVAVALNLHECGTLSGDALEAAVKEIPDQEVFKALMGINGKYVFASDVVSTTGKVAKTSQKPIKTIRLDQVFDTRADFVAAYEERFKTEVSVEAPSEDVPPGYSSWNRFTADVKDMRAEGSSDASIAEDLAVSVHWVAKVS